MCPTVRRWTKIYDKMKAARAPFTLKELDICGKDLVGEIEDRNIGRILHALLLQCAKNPALNRRGYLLQEAKRLEESGEI